MFTFVIFFPERFPASRVLSLAGRKFRVEEVQWRTEILATLMQPTIAQSVRK
jgi:hypothetical protein